MIEDALKVEDSEFTKVRVEQKINPIIKKLDAEIKNSKINAAFTALGIPIVTTVGTLALNYFGLDLSNSLSLTVSGASPILALKNRITDRNIYSKSPYYFLWKINNSK